MSAALGLAGIVLALLILAQLMRPQEVGPAKPGFEWLFAIAPPLLVIGVVVVVRAIAFGARALSGRNLLISGLIMILVGGFPWLYTELMIGDRGMEGSGTLGTLLFLLVGVPGVLVTLAGFFLRDWGSD